MVENDPTTSGARASVVAVYETDEQARMGFDALREIGVPEERITVVGAGEAGAGEAFEAAASPTARGAERGALFGAVAGALVTIVIPGGAVVLASGLVAGAMAGAGLGVLTEVGVPTAHVKDYEEDLTVGRYLLVAHGAPDEASGAHAALDMTDTEELTLYR